MKTGILLFLPDEFLPLLIAVAGLLFIVGAKKAASGLISFVLASIFLPVLLAPLFDLLPHWVVWALIIYAVFLIPFLFISMLGGLISPVMSKHAVASMEGDLATQVMRFMLMFPFRFAGLIFRGIKALVIKFRRNS